VDLPEVMWPALTGSDVSNTIGSDVTGSDQRSRDGISRPFLCFHRRGFLPSGARKRNRNLGCPALSSGICLFFIFFSFLFTFFLFYFFHNTCLASSKTNFFTMSVTCTGGSKSP
jgi:hypothetical protein